MLRKNKKLISKLLFVAMSTSLAPTTIAFAKETVNNQVNYSATSVTVNSAVSKKVLNDEISYAEDVVKKLNNAISVAKSVSDDSSATQNEVNNAAEELKKEDKILARMLQTGTLAVSHADVGLITTTTGTVPTLPTKVKVQLSNGTTTSAEVKWNADASNPGAYTYAGIVDIYGTLEAYDNYSVHTAVATNIDAGQTTTGSQIVLSFIGDTMGGDIPSGKVEVLFKLNVDNQEDYNIIVRGVNAVYDKECKEFLALVDGSDLDLSSLKLTSSDFIVTKNNNTN